MPNLRHSKSPTQSELHIYRINKSPSKHQTPVYTTEIICSLIYITLSSSWVIPSCRGSRWLCAVSRVCMSVVFPCEHAARMIQAGWSFFLPVETRSLRQPASQCPARRGRHVPVIHGDWVRAQQPWLHISWGLQQPERWIRKFTFSLLPINQQIIV